jgi:hypothetical protein
MARKPVLASSTNGDAAYMPEGFESIPDQYATTGAAPAVHPMHEPATTTRIRRRSFSAVTVR